MAASQILDIDSNVRSLVEALNAFDGIETVGSCGGHPPPLKDGQWPEGTWYIKFRVEPDEHGWRALEFLAWLVNRDYRRAGHQVILYPDAPPPYLNEPGQVLAFELEGSGGESAEALGQWVDRQRSESYVPPPKPSKEPDPHSRAERRKS
jgi:hypothetical protein